MTGSLTIRSGILSTVSMVAALAMAQPPPEARAEARTEARADDRPNRAAGDLPQTDGGGDGVEQQRLMLGRLEHRMRGKLTLDLQAGGGFLAITRLASDASLGALVARLMVGFRRNYSPSFGLHLRGGMLIGVPTYTVGGPTIPLFDEGVERDRTSMAGAMIEATPFLGPFGRFYVGPTLWAAYLGFSRSLLEAKGEKVNLNDGPSGGLGLDCGFLAGQREQIDLNFSFRGDFARGGSLLFLFGVGFHL
jgi:hypothetical protein